MTRMTRLTHSPGLRIVVAIAIAFVALILRLHAANQLPVDYDEPIYLRGAQAYADGIRAGQLSALFEDNSPENPPLMKLFFGLGLALAGQPAPAPVVTDLNQPLPQNLLLAARTVSAAFGALGVFLLALVSPLAGAALAIQTLHIKYTSEVLLEGLPFAASLLCVIAYQRSHGQMNRWLILSAIALGLTAASKYLYCIAAIAVLVDWGWRIVRARSPNSSKARDLCAVLIWGGVAIAVFLAANPYLWPDPVGRLIGSLTFHRANSSTAINADRYLPWQPLVWLATTPSFRPDVFLARLDPVLLVLAAFGAPALWRTQRVYAIWLGLGLLFLLVYSNRWPQYPLILLAPLCLSFALGVRELLQRPTSDWLRRHAPGLALAGVAAVWSIWLGQNWHRADPAYQAAMQVVQTRIRPGEVALFATANPTLELASLPSGGQAWDWSSSNVITPGQVTTSYAVASDWLNTSLANRTGAWLLTYQGGVADPADTLRTFMQRQAHLLSPEFNNSYPRGYELTHYVFDAPYRPTPPIGAFAQADADAGYGKPVGLTSRGCAQLRPAQVAGMLEVTCLWQTSPFAPLEWDTKVSLRLFDAQGAQVVQSDQMIARSGFPTTRYEGEVVGNYFIQLPEHLTAGPYILRAFAYGSDGEYAPRISAGVTLSPATP